MRATFKAQHPDGIDMALTVSMSLADWKKLREQLQPERNVWPLCDLLSNIDTVVRHAEKHFESSADRRGG